ncbi:MAG: hypothetical protein J6M43_05860 [Neisseriaceae bacterium]|nr:hypothetical protein [Neisseriaceae bacterium]MBQ9182528.1 hypothetical protein [Neisseriaceae bacterium]
MKENEISHSSNAPIIRFMIWVVMSFISLFICYLIAQANGGKLWGMVSVNSKFISITAIFLLCFMFIAEVLQKQDTWVMIGNNIFIGFAPALFFFFLALIPDDDGLGTFLMLMMALLFVPLGIITTINTIAVRIHYVICRNSEQKRNQIID